MVTLDQLDKCEYFTVHVMYIGDKAYFTVYLYNRDSIDVVNVDSSIDFTTMMINKRHKLFGLFFD